MKSTDIELKGEIVKLRLIANSDKDLYYTVGFENEDKESAYYTGTTGSYTKEMIDKYIDKIIDDATRYDFLIFDHSSQLLGEAVIKDIDEESKQAGFRICLFNAQHFNKGAGTEATRLVVRFAFEVLYLHRLELEVYDFNPRAKHVYEKVGFVQEGVKRDAAYLYNAYRNIIIMSMLESDYRRVIASVE